MSMSSFRWQKFRSRGVWLAVFGLTALATGLFCWRASYSARRPNVLLITLDTTRADRLGCYGYALALTPALDSLAAEGVLFERAYTPAPLTLPSHASLMTGLHPPEHGLITNGRGRLDESIPTLAETLRDAGYDTGAFLGSFVLDSKFGLDKGFTEYDDDMTNTDPTHSGLHRQRDGVWVVDAALAWLKRPRAQPFFCWVHLYDAHAPYLSKVEEFGDRFNDRPYDGGIAYVDRQVERLVKHLDSNRLRKETLVVVAGDHGEGLGDHDELLHGVTLYNSVIQVPWIWAGRGAIAAGRRVPQPVSLVDLPATLLECVGLHEPGPTQGRSLRAALAGGEIAAGNCYSATDFPLLEYGWSPLRSLTTERWKYIRSPEVELYDLASDPHERMNLAGSNPEQVQALEDELAALEQTMAPRQGVAVELTPHERMVLASLGYLGGNSPENRANEPGKQLPDVKRMLPLHNRAEAANRLKLAGDAPAAEQQLRELFRDAPDYLPAQVYLAAALRAQRKFAESREVCAAVVGRDPDNSEAHFEIASTYVAERQFAKAADEFRQALVNRPNAPGVLFNLGHALEQLGQTEEAERLYRQSVEEDPHYLNAQIGLGTLLTAQQRMAEAEELYREALRYTPTSSVAHSRLAFLFVGQNRLAEAGAHLRRAVELSPKDAELHYNYGMLLLQVGRPDGAILAFEKTLQLDPQHAQARMRLQQVRNQRRG
jgi:arylsulfatase A-like enzyme/Tfp pilus assembly protein PilF